jgi:hypothetical protein
MIKQEYEKLVKDKLESFQKLISENEFETQRFLDAIGSLADCLNFLYQVVIYENQKGGRKQVQKELLV